MLNIPLYPHILRFSMAIPIQRPGVLSRYRTSFDSLKASALRSCNCWRNAYGLKIDIWWSYGNKFGNIWENMETYGKYNRYIFLYIYIWKHLGTNMETYSRIYDSIWTLKGENREFLWSKMVDTVLIEIINEIVSTMWNLNSAWL